MLDSIQELLDAFPQCVVQIRDGTITAANAAAVHCLPQLVPGEPLPEWLVLPRYAPSGSGVFTAGQRAYSYSCTSRGEEQLLLFAPAAQAALTDRQLEGALYQLRALLGDILAEVGPATGAPGGAVAQADFGKTFHRLFRLLENLDFMRRMAQGEEYQVTPIDLEGLCRRVTAHAYPLLREAGITLDYESTQSSLPIPGVDHLLRRLVLGLIANAAQAMEGQGRVVLSLRRSGRHALLTVSDNGPLPNPKNLAALIHQGGDIPLPGQGAGLGLAVIQHIVRLHHGTMLTELGQSTPTVLVSLPAGFAGGRPSVKSLTSRSQWDGGLDPVLTELSDLLPARVFGLEGLD